MTTLVADILPVMLAKSVCGLCPLLSESFRSTEVARPLERSAHPCRIIDGNDRGLVYWIGFAQLQFLKLCEPDLLGTPDSEILEGFSDQGVTQYLVFNVYTVSTSSSSTQENLLPSSSAIIPAIQSESLLKIPIPTTTTTTTTSPANNLNTFVSSLETETRSLTTPDKFNALSTETLPESVPTTFNS
ncbi:hypothetical protein TNCV_4340891 [Trichonephila clavipes]|nr:hypothetical protein TNCV_4340891 [Trichonephila clavipes]